MSCQEDQVGRLEAGLGQSPRLPIIPPMPETSDAQSTSEVVSKMEPPTGSDLTAACMENVFIGISGIIGAGKSTLATALGGALGLPVYYEPVQDNAYLEDFYTDMSKHAFPMQVYLLNKRFEQQQQIIWGGKGGVQDRTIYEDSVFARMLCSSGHMSERDYDTYVSLFQHMSNFMKKPNIIVHLDLTPEEALRRINMRNRGCESGITIEYLTALHKAYDEFISDISRVVPVIHVDYSQFRSVEEMAQAIKHEYSQIANIRHVSFRQKIKSGDGNVRSARSPNAMADKAKEKRAAGQALRELQAAQVPKLQTL